MKKSTFLLFTLGMILHAAFSQAFAYDNLYVIGDGCAAAWNQSEAIEMTNAGNDIFTWRGSLIGNGRFKFLLARNTWDALSCEFETNTENIVISPDIETDIYERPNVAGNNDVCFKVSETAVYDIVINTATMKIIVTKNTTDPDLHQLYLAGGATPCEWNIGSFIKMTKLSEGEFFWYGNLSGGDGHIQFLSLQKWEIRIGPATNQTVFTSGAEYNLQRVDNRFIANASNSGLYEVYINLKTMKAKFTKAPDLSQLYMVGDATSVQWTPSGNAPLTKIANGVFSWTGHLNQGQRKFMNQPGWEKNICPVSAFSAENPTGLNIEYDLHYRPLNATPPADNKFYIAAAGEYTVNVDLNTMKASISAAVNNNIATDTPWDLNTTPYTGGNIIFNEDAQLQNATDLTVAGVVKVVKTFETAKWYPAGFPFAINDIQIKYGETTVQGQIYENDPDEFDYTSEGLSASNANMFVKYYNGATNRFHFTDAMAANTGYAIQFSKADLGNANTVEVTFTSAPNPHLHSVTGTPGDYDASDYTLVVNPNVANTSALTGATDYYQFDYYSNPAYPNGHYIQANTDELATALKPFEAIVVYSGTPGQQNRVIGAGNAITGLNEILEKDSVIAAHYYNLQGVEIPQIGTGLYIVKTVYQSGAVSVNKIIRK